MSTTTNRRGPPVGLHRLVGSDLLCTHTVSFDEVDNVGTGTRARRLRTDRRLSLREVARRLGWSAAYVSDLERGRRGWKPETAEKYATAIGANVCPVDLNVGSPTARPRAGGLQPCQTAYMGPLGGGTTLPHERNGRLQRL
jgi:hypothetical protein